MGLIQIFASELKSYKTKFWVLLNTINCMSKKGIFERKSDYIQELAQLIIIISVKIETGNEMGENVCWMKGFEGRD